MLFSNLVDRQRLDRASRPCSVLSLPRHLWAPFCLSRHAMAGCAAFDRPSTSRFHQPRRGAVLRPRRCCQSVLTSNPPPHKDNGMLCSPGCARNMFGYSIRATIGLPPTAVTSHTVSRLHSASVASCTVFHIVAGERTAANSHETLAVACEVSDTRPPDILASGKSPAIVLGHANACSSKSGVAFLEAWDTVPSSGVKMRRDGACSLPRGPFSNRRCL